MAPLCPFCGGPCGPQWGHGAFVRCRACGLIRRDPLPGEQKLADLYRASWQHPLAHREETGGTTPKLARTYARKLADSLHLADFSGLSLLDFGAGSGAAATALAELGAAITAVEPFGHQHLRQQGIRVYPDLQQLPAEARFDGIVCLDVLEHLTAPWETLLRLRGRLAENGWIFLATPNPAGLNARLRGPRWREARKPGHLMFFDSPALERLLQRCGYPVYRRLVWTIAYSGGALGKLQDYSLQIARLDGELRYLARKQPAGAC